MFECCPKTIQSHLKHDIYTNRICEKNYENWFFNDSHIFRQTQSVWVLSENKPKPSEASYLDRQNVWEGSTKTDSSLIHMFFTNPQSNWVLSENNPKPSEASYLDRQNVWEGSTKTDFSLIHIIFRSTKCVSVVRKQTKAIWSMIYRHTECVRGVYENRFFIDFHPQHQIYRRHSSVWVLSENRPNNKRTHLRRYAKQQIQCSTTKHL